MNLHFEDVPCPCGCVSETGMHHVRRYWFDDSLPSAEAKTIMDEIVKDAIRSVERGSA